MATHLCYRDGLNNLLLNSSVMCWSNSNNIYFLNFLQTMKMKLQNPWNVQSLYDLQYFNCPSPFCIYRNNNVRQISQASKSNKDHLKTLKKPKMSAWPFGRGRLAYYVHP